MYNQQFMQRLRNSATKIEIKPGASPEEIVQRLDTEATLGNNVYVVIETKSNNISHAYKLYSMNSPEENLAKLKVMQKMADAKKSFSIAVSSHDMETAASDIINDNKFERIQELDTIFSIAALAEKNPEEAIAKYAALPGTPEEKYKKYGRALVGAKHGKALLDVISTGLDDKTKGTIITKSKQADVYFAGAEKQEENKQKCAVLKETKLPLWEDKIKKAYLCDRYMEHRLADIRGGLDSGNLSAVMKTAKVLELLEFAETATPEQIREKYNESFPKEKPHTSVFLQSDKAYVFVDVLTAEFEAQLKEDGFYTAAEISEQVAEYKEGLLRDVDSVEHEFKSQESQKEGNGYFADKISSKTAARLNAMKGRLQQVASTEKTSNRIGDVFSSKSTKGKGLQQVKE